MIPVKLLEAVSVGINVSSTLTSMLPLAPLSIMQKFSKLGKSVIDLQYSNISQIEKLTKIRDALLPKLMSGEIRV